MTVGIKKIQQIFARWSKQFSGFETSQSDDGKKIMENYGI